MIKKELAGYSRVPGSTDQKTDFGRFGEHPTLTSNSTEFDPNYERRFRRPQAGRGETQDRPGLDNRELCIGTILNFILSSKSGIDIITD